MKVGDKVTIVPGTIIPTVQSMLEDNVGTIVGYTGVEFWDFVVHFEGTDRPGGQFGFMKDQIRKVEN